MKKIIYLLLFSIVFLNSNLSAQTGVRFGFLAGYSLATQYGITPATNIYKVETSGRSGFAGGLFLYYPITESVGIQQEFFYAMKGSRQDVKISVPFYINTVPEYNLNYIELPISIKYRFVNIDNVSIYGSTGIALSLLVNGDYTINSTINTGGQQILLKESGDIKGLDTFDYSFVYGLGALFKMLNKDFFIELRMSVGWNTLAMPNASGAEPVPLRNQDYILAVGMYF